MGNVKFFFEISVGRIVIYKVKHTHARARTHTRITREFSVK